MKLLCYVLEIMNKVIGKGKAYILLPQVPLHWEWLHPNPEGTEYITFYLSGSAQHRAHTESRICAVLVNEEFHGVYRRKYSAGDIENLLVWSRKLEVPVQATLSDANILLAAFFGWPDVRFLSALSSQRVVMIIMWTRFVHLAEKQVPTNCCEYDHLHLGGYHAEQLTWNAFLIKPFIVRVSSWASA